MSERIYLAIDLKSFYASVECIERYLDPLNTNLLVADEARTDKTICLAVSPSLKEIGVPGRPRLFEAKTQIRSLNNQRLKQLPDHTFYGKSFLARELKNNPHLEVDFIIAKPRMALYLDYSTRVYQVYLKHVSADDISVYSIDEVFIDITDYLKSQHLTAQQMCINILKDVYQTTGLTATAGIGTNLYLAKVAMDIVAKKAAPNEYGVRLAQLDETRYRELLWTHTPITDFWRVGPGIASRLAQVGIYTMGDIARCALGGGSDYYCQELLYKLLGINAELLIDHAFGYEPVCISDIKKIRPQRKSLGQGQVLHCPYNYTKTEVIVKEMLDALALDLVDKRLVCQKLVLTIGYDINNLQDPNKLKNYKGVIVYDSYGRAIPKHAHGTINLNSPSSAASVLREAGLELFERIINKNLDTRRVNLYATNLLTELELQQLKTIKVPHQTDLFIDEEQAKEQQQAQNFMLEREHKLQQVMLKIKQKFGKNAIMHATSLEEGATGPMRNRQIGGHQE